MCSSSKKRKYDRTLTIFYHVDIQLISVQYIYVINKGGVSRTDAGATAIKLVIHRYVIGVLLLADC